MNILRRTHLLLLALLVVGLVTVPVVTELGESTILAAEPEMKIEVTMKDKEYHVKGHTMPGVLTAIVLRNEDTVAHGFASNLFKTVGFKKEGEGTEVRKKGVVSIHVDPGKTATLYFKKASKPERETMQFPFWCDIHPQMKGEFLIVETTGEIGGG